MVNHHSAHFPLQDLKPGNLAVNQDCELKVCTVKDYSWISSCDLSNKYTTHRVFCSGVIPSASVEDLGLWLGPQRRCWDDGLRGDPLVPGSWGHSELDALHPDWQENCSCYIFPAAVLPFVSVMCRTVCAVRAAAILILLTGLYFFPFQLWFGWCVMSQQFVTVYLCLVCTASAGVWAFFNKPRFPRSF